MRKDAEANAEQDRKQRELIDAKNQADSLAYQAEKTIKDFEGKGDAAEIENIKKAAEELKTAAAGDDVEDIKLKSEALTKALYPFVEKMYQQQGGPNPDQAGPNPGADAGSTGGQEQATDKTDDNVVDAEFTEVDKEDK